MDEYKKGVLPLYEQLGIPYDADISVMLSRIYTLLEVISVQSALDTSNEERLFDIHLLTHDMLIRIYDKEKLNEKIVESESTIY